MISKNIAKILLGSKTIAVVGCSSDRTKESNKVARFLISQGYEIIPVNPYQNHVLGLKTFARVRDIKKQIDIINIFRPGPECPEIVQEAMVLKPLLIWMQTGIINDAAKNIAVAHETCIIMDKCIKVEIKKLKNKFL
jgi:uncharacterized protein